MYAAHMCVYVWELSFSVSLGNAHMNLIMYVLGAEWIADEKSIKIKLDIRSR